MALYHYKCPECGFVDEVMRKFAEADEPWGCSQCGATTQRILYPGCSFDMPAFKHGQAIRID